MAAAQDPDTLVELSGRLIYSLLTAAVKTAARFKMPMARVVELLQMAYYEELRRKNPRNLNKVAKELGQSLRTAGILSKRSKEEFFQPETDIKPLREITALLTSGAKSKEKIIESLKHQEVDDVERALEFLLDNGWLKEDGGKYQLNTQVRSYIDDNWQRRIDGLNHQMEVIGNSVWNCFLEGNNETASARSWTFAARPEDFAEMMNKSCQQIRHNAIDVEDTALNDGISQRYAVTIAFTPVKDEKNER